MSGTDNNSKEIIIFSSTSSKDSADRFIFKLAEVTRFNKIKTSAKTKMTTATFDYWNEFKNELIKQLAKKSLDIIQDQIKNIL